MHEKLSWGLERILGSKIREDTMHSFTTGKIKVRFLKNPLK